MPWDRAPSWGARRRGPCPLWHDGLWVGLSDEALSGQHFPLARAWLPPGLSHSHNGNTEPLTWSGAS